MTEKREAVLLAVTAHLLALPDRSGVFYRYDRDEARDLAADLLDVIERAQLGATPKRMSRSEAGRLGRIAKARQAS